MKYSYKFHDFISQVKCHLSKFVIFCTIFDFVKKEVKMCELTQNAHRKMLAATVSSLLIDLGIDTCDRDVLGTLTEMLQCCK